MVDVPLRSAKQEEFVLDKRATSVEAEHVLDEVRSRREALLVFFGLDRIERSSPVTFPRRAMILVRATLIDHIRNGRPTTSKFGSIRVCQKRNFLDRFGIV